MFEEIFRNKVEATGETRDAKNMFVARVLFQQRHCFLHVTYTAVLKEETLEKVAERIEELKAEKEDLMVQLAGAEAPANRKTLSKALKELLEDYDLRESLQEDPDEEKRTPKIPKRIPSFTRRSGPA